jgi:inhibitor of KinA sporulation pathway (predicted exonuclease)
MKSHIANVIDLEINCGWEIIEFGLTTVDLAERKILQTYSIPISGRAKLLSPAISALTGWTDKKLDAAGVPFHEACYRIRDKYGGHGRLLITDSEMETVAIKRHLNIRYSSSEDDERKAMYPFGGRQDTLNVSSLYKIKTGDFYNRSLTHMLNYFDLEFEGRLHRASADSYNIARLFLELIK